MDGFYIVIGKRKSLVEKMVSNIDKKITSYMGISFPNPFSIQVETRPHILPLYRNVKKEKEKWNRSIKCSKSYLSTNSVTVIPCLNHSSFLRPIFKSSLMQIDSTIF